VNLTIDPSFAGNFHKSFEFWILQLILRDEGFSKELYRNIEEGHFLHNHLKYIFTIVREFSKKFHRFPTKDELFNELIAKSDLIGPSTTDSVLKMAKKLYYYNLPDRDYISSNLEYFLRKTGVMNLIVEAMKEWPTYSIDEFKRRVDVAYKIKVNPEALGTSVADLLQGVLSRGTEPEGCPTGMPGLDRALGGCLRPGDLAVFMAPTNWGKTFTVINLTRQLWLNGANVLLVTLEEIEQKLNDRFIASLTQQDLRNIDDYKIRQMIVESLQQFEVMTDSTMIVKYFNAFSVTAQDIELHIQRVEEETGRKLDVVVLDYADLIKPTQKLEARRLELENIYRELKNVGERNNIGVITSSQGNRTASAINYNPKTGKYSTPKSLDISHIAESQGKANAADFIFSLREPVDTVQLQQDYPRSMLVTMDVSKTRASKRHAFMDYAANFHTQYMEELPEGYINRKNLDEEVAAKNKLAS
jgi:replicative DNA helicase